MNKFVLALDGLRLSESAIEYAAWFGNNFKAHIVAAFLRDIAYKSQPVGQDIWWPYYSEYDWEQIKVIDEKDNAKQQKALNKLQMKFDAAGVQYNIHKDKIIALQSLLLESHFADAVIADVNTSFSNYDKTKPSQFVRGLLSDAACPVILTPGKFKPIERFVFAYDGQPSSAYAIRQFTSLFPVVKHQELEIVFVTDKKNTTHLPHQKLLKELLKHKYTTVLQSVLRRRNTEEALLEHLKTENKKCMLVLGAYDRSSFSMWLHHSVADRLIQELQIPLFVAHR